MASPLEWSENKEFIAELNDRVKRWEDGIDPGFTLDEVKASLEKLRKERAVSPSLSNNRQSDPK